MKIQVGPDDKGSRLDQFLARHLENVTRSHIQLLNRTGAVQIDGRQEKSGYRMRGNESVEVELRPDLPTELVGEAIPFQIHYEDSDLAVIEKPAGLVVHPGSGAKTGTVVHALVHHFQNLANAGGERPGIVHRLDKLTSGLLIVAKNNETHAALGKQFQARTIEKRYIALVLGKLTKPSGIIDVAIARHPTIRTRMSARPDRGRSAYTEYTTLEAFRDLTLLDVRIKTGRTHQIRVHLSSIGHPVVGDDVYGERRMKEFEKKYGALHRYFLHAAYLKFTHPRTGQIMEFQSPLPPELQDLLGRIRI